MRRDTRLQQSGGDQLLRSVIASPELVAVLSDARQRRVLSLLLNRSGSIVVRDIAVHLAARAADTSPSNVPKSTVNDVLIDLHHRCLPKLEAKGLIECSPAGTVEVGERLLEAQDAPIREFDAPRFPSWEELAALFENPRRWHAALILSRRRQPIPLEALAAELRAEWQSASTAGGVEDDHSLRVKLHHVDLPRLADEGLIDYDADERTIAVNDSTRALGHWADIVLTAESNFDASA